MLSRPMACGILVPWPGIELKSLALEGEFLTNGAPGKVPIMLLKDNASWSEWSLPNVKILRIEWMQAGLGQRCHDDRGSYAQCCEVTWMKYTSLDCVSLSSRLRSWPTCSPREALHFQKTLGSPCVVFISSDTMPGTLGSGRHANNGFPSLEGDWNDCHQAQQLAAVFTDQRGEQGIPSQYPRGLELDGTWGGVGGVVAVSSAELSYSQLFACPVGPWVSVGPLFPSDELICRILCVRSSSVVQVEDRRAVSVPNTTHTPHHGWTHLRIYSTPSLCGCGSKGLGWDASLPGSQGQWKLAPPRYLRPAARALWVPYGRCVQCTWHPRTVTSYASLLSSVSV